MGGGAGGLPEGDLPADAYQRPEAAGDEGYWHTVSGGYYQQPDES
jgi:hypothetical protein